MIPNQTLSSSLEYAPFIYPDDLEESNLLSYELGGIALSDPTAGLEYQVWTLQGVPQGGTADPVDVVISSPNTPATVLFSFVGITEVSLAFDQNMHPFVAFVQSGNPKYYWYDPTIPGFTFANLIAGAINPRASLDDKRKFNVSSSDIILAYIRSDNLCFRAQRDRFGVEYVLQAALSTKIIAPGLYKIGMNQIERFEFWLKGALYV